jgi:hypothetical protein
LISRKIMSSSNEVAITEDGNLQGVCHEHY